MTLAVTMWAIGLIVLVWWGPGWLLGEAMAIPRVLLPMLAPVIGLGLLSVIGSVGNGIGLAWTPLSVTAATLAVAALTYLARRALRRRRPLAEASEPPKLPRWRTLAVGVAPAAVVAGVTWLGGTSRLATINQDWDIPWHANMIRLIAQSHHWDPHIAGHFAYYDTSLAAAPIRSYPIALHAVLALAWPSSGLTIPTFINAFVLVLLTLQLPLSTMALTLVITRRPLAVAAAGAVSAWLAVYPYDLLWRGPLIPYFAGMLAVGPFVLMAVVMGRRRQWSTLPAVSLGAVALVAVHPSLAFVAAPVVVCWLLALLARRPREALLSALYLLAAAVVAGVLGLPIIREMLQEAGRVSNISWPPDSTEPVALRNLFLLSHGGSRLVYVAPLLVFLALVGIAVRRRSAAWYLVPTALYGAMAVYTMSTKDKPTWFTTPFYDDQWRIYAVYVMLLAPLLGLGVDVAVSGLARLGRAVGSRVGATALPGSRRLDGPVVVQRATAAVVVVALLAVSLPGVSDNTARLRLNNKVSGRTLSAGEVRLMSNISRWVPASDTVLSDPCDGSVWMYALGNRMPMIRHFEIRPTQRQQLLLGHFRDLVTNPEVRAAAAELGIGWVYVASGRIRAWDRPRGGLIHLGSLPFLRLVVRYGNASLYRLDWTRVPGGAAALAAARAHRLTEPGVPGTWESTDPSPIRTGWSVC